MLKPTDPVPGAAPPGDERPVGELVHQLVEDGKAYARAELNVAKAIAAAKGDALKVPAILFGGALLLMIAAAAGLAVGVALALALVIGPLAAGLLTFLVFAGIAGGLAWMAIKRIQRDL